MRSIPTGARAFIAALALTSILAIPSSALAQSGGTTAPGGDPSSPPSAATTPGARAKLMPNGKAVAPASAPIEVQNAIAAGNRIRKKPYRWGGGHASFEDTGYDCSGAVSYVLNAAGLLKSPMPSGSFMKWASPGKGQWITVYANGGHMHAVIAGLRWDTSAYGSGGKGPRWRATKRPARGFAVRHAQGF